MPAQRYSRATEDNADSGGDARPSDAGSDSSSSDSDYAFDGFKVMFAEKVMLTPVAPAAPMVHAQTRRWH
jgi:hypothetical protein